MAISAVSWFSWRSGVLSGLRDGYLRCSKSEDSFRIDFRRNVAIDVDGGCCGLVSSVVCVLLVVAIYDMNGGGKTVTVAWMRKRKTGKRVDDMEGE